MRQRRSQGAVTLGLATLLLAALGCGASSPGGAGGSGMPVIQNKGSDTMVNVAQAWAEAYKKVQPGVEVEVSGGGSGVGIAALSRGAVDIANASRDMKPKEVEDARRNTGKDPEGFIAGYDALAIFVHKDNPLEVITMDEIARIYAEDATISRWSQLGVKLPARYDEIIRVSRQSSSGTYEFLRDRALHKKDFKLGSCDLNGSKEVVDLVGSTPGAIGYSGMGYATPAVKMLRVALTPGGPAFAPTVETTAAGTYPIARSLNLYTLGKPEGPARGYIDWIRSDAGQAIVTQTGYVPIPSSQRTKAGP